MELHDETRDGLRAFSVDSGRETMRATLGFRVGQADESLATSGWTHLLEHSALHGWKDPRLTFNASVGLYVTRFDLDGERDAVLEHLLRLTRWLASPDLSEIEHEAKVLRAESEQRPVGDAALNFDWRYGAQGPGVLAYREIGLARATAERLHCWCAQMFGARNAVLMADQRLPDEFRHALPLGERRAPRLPTPVASSLPGAHWVPSGLVASGEITRSFAGGLASDVLARTLTDTFRQAQGVAYGPWADLERVDRDTGLLICGTDISSDGRPASGSDFVAVLSRLAEHGPAQSMLDDLTVFRERFYRDPANAPSLAWSAGFAVLTDSEVYSIEQAQELAAAVTPEDVAEVVTQFQRSLVLGLPQGAEAPEGVDILRARTDSVLDGATRHLHGSGEAALWLSDDALQHVSAGQLTTVHFADVAGVLDFPDGARQVISKDGWSIMVEPTAYRRGGTVVAELDARIPPELRLPQPERDAAHIPKRIGALGRAGHWFRRYGSAMRVQFRKEGWFGKASLVWFGAVMLLVVVGLLRALVALLL